MRFLFLASTLAGLGVSLSACVMAMSNSGAVHGASTPGSWGGSPPIYSSAGSNPSEPRSSDSNDIVLRRR